MIERFDQLAGGSLGEIGDGKLFGIAMVDAPDAAEVVVAIGTHGGVDLVVVGAAGVVVDDGLIVEVADVERAIGADADFDRAPPHVLAADEFRLLAARQFRGRCS